MRTTNKRSGRGVNDSGTSTEGNKTPNRQNGVQTVVAYGDVKDSGEREVFSTGSKRDTRKGKGRYDLITPLGLKRLAVHYENGAIKYGDRNWEKGQPLSRYLDSAIRHLYCYLAGMRDEDHLAAIA